MTKVFISSVQKEFSEERKALVKYIREDALTILIHKVALNMAPKVAPKENWPKDTADCWKQ